MNKKVIPTIIFFSVSIMGMEPEQLPCSITLLTKDCVREIAPFLSLQTMGRLRQASRTCIDLFNTVRVCSNYYKGSCSSPSCSLLANNYYKCTQALAYCARKDINDVDMFVHWWPYHAVARYYDLFLLSKHVDTSIQARMRIYGKHYSTEKKIRRRILHDVENIFYSEESRKNIFVIETLFMGSKFTIFDLIKKNTGMYGDYEFKVDVMLYKACKLNDHSLIRALCGKSIDGRWLDYIIEYSKSSVIAELVKKDIVRVDLMAPCCKKRVLHYAAEYNWDKVIGILLTKGAYVNCRDRKGKTPLHYAAKNYCVDAVRALLKSDDADPRCTTNWGKTVLDYVSHKNGWETGDERDDRLTIKKLLQEHIKQHSQVEKSPEYNSENGA